MRLPPLLAEELADTGAGDSMNFLFQLVPRFLGLLDGLSVVPL